MGWIVSSREQRLISTVSPGLFQTAARPTKPIPWNTGMFPGREPIGWKRKTMPAVPSGWSSGALEPAAMRPDLGYPAGQGAVTVSYDSAEAVYDPAAECWRVHFYTRNQVGGDQTVYLDREGRAERSEYGE